MEIPQHQFTTCSKTKNKTNQTPAGLNVGLNKEMAGTSPRGGEPVGRVTYNCSLGREHLKGDTTKESPFPQEQRFSQ